MNKGPLDTRRILLWDGNCGFCRRWVQRMERWFPRHPRPVPFQEADLESFGVTKEQCAAAVQFINGDGKVFSGSDAVARILITAGFPFLIAGYAMFIPGIRAISQWCYQWVANNRHRF